MAFDCLVSPQTIWEIPIINFCRAPPAKLPNCLSLVGVAKQRRRDDPAAPDGTNLGGWNALSLCGPQDGKIHQSQKRVAEMSPTLHFGQE